MLTCAASNTYLEDLTWTTWGATVATGRGTLVENTCTPNCASGELVSEPAAVAIGALGALGALGNRDGLPDYAHVWMSPLPPNSYRLRSFSNTLYYGPLG